MIPKNFRHKNSKIFFRPKDLHGPVLETFPIVKDINLKLDLYVGIFGVVQRPDASGTHLCPPLVTVIYAVTLVFHSALVFFLVVFFRICFYCFCVSYDILSCTFYADSL